METTANGQDKPEGQEPDKQSRRDSRAFANQRRENRDLHRQIGRMEALIEGLRPQSFQAENGQPEQRQPTPQEIAAANRSAELSKTVLERIEDAGDEIEGFDKVMQTITEPDFPINTVMRDFLGESDKPAEMATWLSENPAEARRISLLSESVALRALERAEAKLAKPVLRTTKAPPPVPTVGGRSTANFDPDKASMEEYADHWRQRQAKR